MYEVQIQKYPDIPQDQYTMDGIIQNMRAAYKRYGRHLTPDQAKFEYAKMKVELQTEGRL